MREIPINMRAPEARAIRGGRKTQFRRPIGLPALGPSATPDYDWTFRGRAPVRSVAQQARRPRGCWQDVTTAQLLALCPYGTPGALLRVREPWGLRDRRDGSIEFSRAPTRGLSEAEIRSRWDVEYQAEDAESHGCRWRSPVTMPRWASRLLLRVIDVRAQRVQDTSEEDARAEGVERDTKPCDHTRYSCEDVGCLGPTHLSTFRAEWTRRASWQANPWVWAVRFEAT